MRVLVIPDIHLKPWIVDRAEEWFNEKTPDAAVFLGDIADDWDKEWNIPLYNATYDRVIKFCEDHNDRTYVCLGNHDLAYMWGRAVSGTSEYAVTTVKAKIKELKETLPAGRVAVMQCLDNCLFSHAGLVRCFAEEYVGKKIPPQQIADLVNIMSKVILWDRNSPLWARPQGEQTIGSQLAMWPEGVLQVVGHTPTVTVFMDGDMLTCDTCSTYRNGKFIGTPQLIIVDTQTREIEKFVIVEQ